MRPTQSQTFGDITVHVNQLPAMDAFALECKLGFIFGPAWSTVIALIDGSVDLKSINASVLGPAIETLFKNLDAIGAKSLVRDVFPCCSAQVNGQHLPLNTDQNVNTVFTGHPKKMLLALKFAVFTQFSDFTEGDAGQVSPVVASAVRVKV